VTSEITKKWKGEVLKRQEFVAAAYFTCGCTPLAQLKEETEYLVFAAGKNFVTVCDSKETKYETTQKEIKRVDRLRFRAWAEIYRFDQENLKCRLEIRFGFFVYSRLFWLLPPQFPLAPRNRKSTFPRCSPKPNRKATKTGGGWF
jgi:ribosomal protein S1